MKNTTLKIRYYEQDEPMPVYYDGEPTGEFLNALEQYEADKRKALISFPFRIVRRAFDQQAEAAKWRQHLKMVEKKTKAIDAEFGTNEWGKLVDRANEQRRQQRIAEVDQLLASHPRTADLWIGRDRRKQGRRINGQFTAKS
jgi:hypothetical protein